MIRSLLTTLLLLSLNFSSAQAQFTKQNAEAPQTVQIPFIGEKTYQPPAQFDPPAQDEFEPEDGGALELKQAVGFERWIPAPAADPDVSIAPGIGWFYQSGLTQAQINDYPIAGYRAIDIEVEQWAPEVRFSAVFVQNLGSYYVDSTYVMYGLEHSIRAKLFGGEWDGFRIVDLEVRRSYGPEIEVGNDPDNEVPEFDSTIIAVLLVPNEGQQFTPEWDFIVHATPIEVADFADSFVGNVRVIDNEVSFRDYDDNEHEGERVQNVVYSQVFVSDEGLEHVETAIFQYDNAIDLLALELEGWQLIDSERNIPLMYEDYPEWYGEFSGVFVQKPNQTLFLQEQDTYSLFPFWDEQDHRIIDIELVPGGDSYLLDELYLLYD